MINFKKILEKREISSKRLIKPSKVTIRIKEFKAPSILEDENRFFKVRLIKRKGSYSSYDTQTRF